MAAKNGSTKGSLQSREDRANARMTVDRALCKLAGVRDLLRNIEDGETAAFCAQDYGIFARAVLEEAGKEIEGSLYQAGFLKTKSAEDLRQGGWFVESDPREARHV